MPSESSENVGDRAVREMLHGALTCGQPPCGAAIVGPVTRAAITAVAQHDPEATVEHVVAVNDSCAAEQGRDAWVSDRPHQRIDERSARAIDQAATDTLITQTITYPRLSRDLIAGVVECATRRRPGCVVGYSNAADRPHRGWTAEPGDCLTLRRPAVNRRGTLGHGR